MSSSLWIILCLGVFASANADKCPNIPQMKDFKIKQYLGLWYVQEIYPNLVPGYTCTQFEFTQDAKQVVHVKSTSINQGVKVVDEGKMEMSPTGSPKLIQVGKTKMPHLVIAANYNEYSVSYNCVEVDGKLVQYVIIMTRDRIPSSETMIAARNKIDHAAIPGLTTKDLVQLSHKDCQAKKETNVANKKTH